MTQSKQYDGLETNFLKNNPEYDEISNVFKDLKVKLKRVNLIDLNWTYAT